MTETRHKCGDVREDGMVFWCYDKSCPEGQYWVTREKFMQKRERDNARRRERRATDSAYRDAENRRAASPERKQKARARRLERYASDPDYRSRILSAQQSPISRERANARRRERRITDPNYREVERVRSRTRRASEEFKKCRNARYEGDPLFATAARLRVRTRFAFTRLAADKPASTKELLGTDWQTLKAHIESQFVDGMSWENMSDWHIDHIIPLASAKTEEELISLCHYTNLQPLWASDNIRKGAKLPHELTESYE